MENRPKILFICNKWCEGNKLFGLSEWESGVQNSLQSTGLAEFQTIHLDEYYDLTKQKGDNEALKKITDYRPDIVYLIMFQMPGSSVNVLDQSTLETIKTKLKVPLVALFGDLAVAEQVKISLTILPYTTLIVAPELSAALERINRPDKYIYSWAPRDPRIFNDPDKVRNIDVSYVGTPKKDRLKKVNYLKNHGINVVHGGGEREEHLTTLQYADRYQRSKITLSFSRANINHVTNARPFEAMPCGAMLLEQESFETMKFFIPYVDYVPYSGKKDLLKKARYYLTHDEERVKIASNGQRKAETLYSAKRFWQIVIDKALGTNSGETYTFDYAIPAESLARLSPFKAFEMRFFNSLCSTSFGFFLYKIWRPKYWQGLLSKKISRLKPTFQKLLPKKSFELLLSAKRKLY
jgi:hypothetical protein